MKKESVSQPRSSADPVVSLSLLSADVQHAKRAMAAAIMKTLDARQWSTRRAEQETGVNHADFTRIRKANVDRYSLERLVAILTTLGQDVELSVHVQPRSSNSAPVERGNNQA